MACPGARIALQSVRPCAKLLDRAGGDHTPASTANGRRRSPVFCGVEQAALRGGAPRQCVTTHAPGPRRGAA